MLYKHYTPLCKGTSLVIIKAWVISSATSSRVICPLDVSQFSRDKQMFLGDNRIISCLCESRACCSLVIRKFSHYGRYTQCNVTRDMSPSLAIAFQKHLRVSTNFLAPCKVFEVAKMEDIQGTCHERKCHLV